MTLCTQAYTSDSGIMTLSPYVQSVENWEEVQCEAHNVEFVQELFGWGRYTAMYRVTTYAFSYLYAVAE